MRCPKCNLVFDERFCPQCGLDLQVYAEMAILKGEVESLRQLIVSRAELDLPGSPLEPEQKEPSAETEVSSGGKRRQTPPPLPPPLPPPPITAERKKSSQEGSSA